MCPASTRRSLCLTGWHLERHHTHCVLVEGLQHAVGGGALLERVLLELARRHEAACKSVFVLINGGPGALASLLRHLERRRPAVVVASSGKAADVLERVLRSTSAEDETDERPALVERAVECARHRDLITVARLADGDLDGAIRRAQVRGGS